MNAHEERRAAKQSLQNFLDGSGEGWELDDLMFTPFSDELMKKIVARLAEIPSEFPASDNAAYCGERGLEEIRKIVQLLPE